MVLPTGNNFVFLFDWSWVFWTLKLLRCLSDAWMLRTLQTLTLTNDSKMHLCILHSTHRIAPWSTFKWNVSLFSSAKEQITTGFTAVELGLGCCELCKSNVDWCHFWTKTFTANVHAYVEWNYHISSETWPGCVLVSATQNAAKCLPIAPSFAAKTLLQMQLRNVVNENPKEEISVRAFVAFLWHVLLFSTLTIDDVFCNFFLIVATRKLCASLPKILSTQTKVHKRSSLHHYWTL